MAIPAAESFLDARRPLLQSRANTHRVAQCIFGSFVDTDRTAPRMLHAVELVFTPERIREIAQAAGPDGAPLAPHEKKRLRRLVRADEFSDACARTVYLGLLGGDAPTTGDVLKLSQAVGMSGLITKTRAGHLGQMAWSIGILALGATISMDSLLNPGAAATATGGLALPLGLALVLIAVGLLAWDLKRYREWKRDQLHLPRPDSAMEVMLAVVQQVRHGAKPTDLLRPDGTVVLERVSTEGLPARVRAVIERAKSSAR